MKHLLLSLLLCVAVLACVDEREPATGLVPIGKGPYPVGSTNMKVLPEYVDVGDGVMHEILLGRGEDSSEPRFVTEILKHPEAAWIVDVSVPEVPELYGPASGQQLPVLAFIAFPSKDDALRKRYAFPYNDARYGTFEDMLSPGEAPRFADPAERYPLVVLAHGASAHGIYDVRRAHTLASHGYIVAVLTYGDDRTVESSAEYDHVGFLRPLLTKAVIDSLLASETFGNNIDSENIGISGHSYGGFTSLAIAGGPFRGNTATVRDDRIKAASIAAPWVGIPNNGDAPFAFGPDNRSLERVSIPIIAFVGTKDELTTAASILPAMRQLGGPTYVIELVDQPHIFEDGSWEDRDAWELLFFSAYLKHDPASLAKLETGRSMNGGNDDIQRVDYQKLSSEN